MATETLTILLIEDDPDDVLLVKESCTGAFLPGTEIRILDTPSLDRGISELSEKTFDLILLDLNLPESPGLPAFDRLLALNHTTPVVVMTGPEDDKAGLDAVRKGAQDYIIKGTIDPVFLQRVIRCAIERNRLTLEHVKLTTTLVDKVRELEKFADYLSHNMKNNVLVIKRIADLAEFNPDFVLKNAGMLAGSCNNLISSVNRLLEHARAGKAITRKAEISLTPIITALFEKARPADLEGAIVIPRPLPPLHCDPISMEKLFLHLIENSIQYRDRNKRSLAITLDYECIPGRIILNYRDNGSGIEADMIDHIFESWNTSEKEDHLGIGLAIVRKTVEAHGGSISAESAGAGQGTGFTIILPFESGS